MTHIIIAGAVMAAYFVIMCLLKTAADADDRMEEMMKRMSEDGSKSISEPTKED